MRLEFGARSIAALACVFVIVLAPIRIHSRPFAAGERTTSPSAQIVGAGGAAWDSLGSFTVATRTIDWKDATRNREVPAKLYYPSNATGPFPVVIFSHGLGGSRNGYEYLGRYWASHGFVSVHLQHKGSDTAVWKDQQRPMQAMRAAAADLRNAVDRPIDVKFAIDQLGKVNDPSQGVEPSTDTLKHRLDLRRVGVAGHSFGAYTTLAVAGMVFGGAGEKGITFSDSRVKAAIAMSAPVSGGVANAADRYGRIAVPILHMTGTLDDSPIGDTSAAQRRIPYDAITAADQYLITFEGGDHMIFSGRGRLAGNQASDANDVAYQKLICVTSTAFWYAYLRDDAGAREWLQRGGAEKALGTSARLEKKTGAGRKQDHQ